MLRHKKEVSQVLFNLIALVEIHYGKQIKIIQSDNETEFISLKRQFLEHGIIFQASCVGTPQKMEELKENIGIFLMLCVL